MFTERMMCKQYQKHKFLGKVKSFLHLLATAVFRRTNVIGWDLDRLEIFREQVGGLTHRKRFGPESDPELGNLLAYESSAQPGEL